jgi:hypothetical protein
VLAAGLVGNRPVQRSVILPDGFHDLILISMVFRVVSRALKGRVIARAQ